MCHAKNGETDKTRKYFITITITIPPIESLLYASSQLIL